MSFCRWSSDNWACDLYCYEDVSGGFTTHVAGSRIANLQDMPKVTAEIGTEEWSIQLKAQQTWDHVCEPIGLAHDGASFNDPDLQSFQEMLLMLREAGYNFPDYVLNAIQEEIDDA